MLDFLTIFFGKISAINKTTVTVTLENGTDVTEASDINNYSIMLGQTPVEVTAVTYNATTRKAVLTVALDKMEGKLTVNGVEASFDFKAPSIKAITPVSSRVFDITYSEAVNAGLAQIIANYGIVESGTANTITGNIAKVEAISADKVRVTMLAALTKDKSYTVTVTGMQDVSANKNTMTTSSSMAFTAIKDEVRPTLVSATATDANKVELQMSEEMSSTAVTATLKKYNADGTLGTAVVNSVAKDAKNPSKLLLTITNSADYLANGSKYQVEVTGGSDIEGNAIADNQKVDFTGKADDVAPTVVASSFADGKLTLTFSEAMNGAELVETDNYAVFETATGITETVTGVVENTSNDHTQAILSFSGLQAGKEYSVRLTGGIADGLKDASITPNALVNNTIVKFTVPTVTTEVKLQGAAQPGTPDGKSVELTFNTDLVKAEAENAANYRIVNAADETKTLAVTKAVYDSASKKVTLTTGAQVDGSSNYKVYVSNLTNLSTKAAETSAAFNGVDMTKPVLTGIEVLGLNTIDLVFNEDMAADQSAGVAVSLVEKGTANTVAANALTATAGHGNKVRVTFAAGKLVAGKTYTLTVTGAKDGSAATNGSDANTLDFTAAADTTAPSIVSAVSTNAATIEVTFNEEIAEAGTLSAANFELKKGDTVVNFAAGTTFTVDSAKKKLTIVNGGVTPAAVLENGTAYTLKVVKDGSNYVSDVAGNAVTDAAYSFTGVKDTTKPELVSSEMKADSDTQVVLTFSEKLKAGINPADFTVTEANTGIPVSVTGAALGTSDDANKVTLTLGAKTKAGVQYRVYVNNANSSVKDLAVSPNLLDTNHAVALFTGADKTAPQVTGTVLKDSKTVDVTFDENINPASVAKTDFVVAGNTVTSAVVSDDLKTITLTLGTAVATDKTDLAISYADGQSVADFAGNSAAMSITSNTDEAAPTLVSVVKNNGTTITLTFSEKVALINMTGNTQDERNAVVLVNGYAVTDIQADGSSTTVTLTVDEMGDALPTVKLASGQTAIKDLAATPNVYTGTDIVVPTAQ
ncbi:MAG: Ig-like domain-containing protein [Clostridium sp.]|nr:Ig-like domain-containing protein [Clostridium sp.]